MLDTPPDAEMAESCRKGIVHRVSHLLDWGVHPDTLFQGRTFLSIACEHGQLEVAKVLLKAGARPTRRDLILAVLAGDVYLADRLSDELYFAGLEYDFWHIDRPLLADPEFLRSTSAAMVKWMIGQGADPAETDRQGRNALQVAEREAAAPDIVVLLRAALSG